MKKSSIVVTGGAGFIGSCVIKYLNEQGMENIIVVDHLGFDEKWKNLVGKKIHEVVDKSFFLNWLQGKENEIGSIIHLGACSDTMENNADYLLENNYRYTISLCEWALKYDKRFIYASSAATYGSGDQGFVDDESSLFSLRPLNMYGFSKQLFDQWAYKQGVLNQIVGLKYFNVFGPNETHKGHMASAIGRWTEQILKGGKVKLFKSANPDLFADGEQKRDFVYVKDVCRITCAFLDNEVGGIFNVGSGRATTWNELASAVFNALGKKPEIEYIEMPKELIGKYQNFSQADMAKTRKMLGKQADSCSLNEAVSDYVKNYLVPGKLW